MLHFNNTTDSIHNPRKTNIFLLPIILLVIASCKKEEITPSGNQVTETRNPGIFKMITTNSAANIHITHGENHSVVIKGSDNLIKHFITTIADGELKLSFQKGNVTSDDLEIWLSMPALESITTSGSGDIKILGNFDDQHSLTTRVRGSGDIKVEGSMRTNFLKSYVSGSGTTDLSNIWANIAEFELTGSGNIYYSGSPTISANIEGTGKLIKINEPND